MSHRTEDLEPLTGFRHTIRELRYHEIARQGLAVVLILLYTIVARPHPLAVLVGMPLALLGMLVRLYASGFIVKNKELATTGAYALVRHPLYTGNVLLLVGFSIATATWWAVPLAVAFFAFYYPAAIEYEDRKLRRLFGEQWEIWSRRTPALMPNLLNAKQAFVGDWSFAKSTRRNGELVIVVYVVVCMFFVIARAF
jgi:protein-S-isoprenylcysteine O-methyltransferase Ste14